MGSENRYQLSEAADADIDAIFDYTVAEFGFDQAVKYLEIIEEHLFVLTNNPDAGKNRDLIKKGMRSLPVGEHLIFYRVLSDSIWVVRILHASRDVQRFL